MFSIEHVILNRRVLLGCSHHIEEVAILPIWMIGHLPKPWFTVGKNHRYFTKGSLYPIDIQTSPGKGFWDIFFGGVQTPSQQVPLDV